MTKDLVNALACALAVLRGEGGGYSLHERANAIEQLDIERERLIGLFLKETEKNG